jgi:hypothetical protein
MFRYDEQKAVAALCWCAKVITELTVWQKEDFVALAATLCSSGYALATLAARRATRRESCMVQSPMKTINME